MRQLKEDDVDIEDEDDYYFFWVFW